MAPPLPSLLAYLVDNQTLRGFTGGSEDPDHARIHGITIPETRDEERHEFPLPESGLPGSYELNENLRIRLDEGPTILVMSVGGMHTRGYVPLISPRFFIRCYGVERERSTEDETMGRIVPSPQQEYKWARTAQLLDQEVFRVLQYGGKKRFAGNTILSAQCETYGFPVRDRESNWTFYSSIYSVEMSTVVTIDPPGIPINLQLQSAQSNSLSWTWLAPANGGTVSSYDVEWRPEESGDWMLMRNVVSPYMITGLDTNTVYQIRVRAKNARGPSAWTNPVSGTTSL